MGKIQYKLAKFKNPASAYNNFYYPKAVSLGIVTTDELSEKISRRCTLTRADVLGCLAALSEVMNEEITSSKKVRLDGIGLFSGSIRTEKMVENIADFTPAKHVKSYGVNFLPEYTIEGGKRITKLLKGASLTGYAEYVEGLAATKKVGGKYVKVQYAEKA